MATPEDWPDEEPTAKRDPRRCPQCLGSKVCGLEPADGLPGLYRLTACGCCGGMGFVSAAQEADYLARIRLTS